MEFLQNLEAVRVVPVIVIKELGQAIPLGQSAGRRGLTVLEIALGNPVAPGPNGAISAEAQEALVRAGTVINAEQFTRAARAKFISAKILAYTSG
jgi:2-dehydro-3-deoxyphosphogluconate aldolase/(4S)-4-hydroxy-2-oxoglutarate aldolase